MQELIHRREHGERKRGRWRSLDIARGRLLAAVSVNLSTRTLEVKEFDSAWLYATLQRDIRHLADYGLRLAADDVGAGNAGLRLLSQVPFDILKRDMSLVQEAARNTVTWAVLRSLRDLARRQEAVVIGEGVETPEQLRALRQLDISSHERSRWHDPSSRPALTKMLGTHKYASRSSLVDGKGDTDPVRGVRNV